MITIAICFHNAEKTLEELLSSLMDQTDRNFTLLFVDNNATDSSRKILESYADRLPMTIVKEEKQGVQYARNKALQEIKTRYFAFVDADDVLSKDYVRLLRENIQEGVLPSVRYLSFLDGEERKTTKKKKGVDVLYPSKGRGYSFDTYKGIYQGFLWNKLFDRNIIDKYGISFDTDIAIGEDSLFIDKYLPHVEKVVLTREVGYFYRIRKDSLTNTENPDSIHLEKLLSERKRFSYLDSHLDKDSNAYAHWAKRKVFYLKRFASYYQALGKEEEIPVLKEEAKKTLQEGLKAKRKSPYVFFQLLFRLLLFRLYFQ